MASRDAQVPEHHRDARRAGPDDLEDPAVPVRRGVSKPEITVSEGDDPWPSIVSVLAMLEELSISNWPAAVSVSVIEPDSSMTLSAKLLLLLSAAAMSCQGGLGRDVSEDVRGRGGACFHVFNQQKTLTARLTKAKGAGSREHGGLPIVRMSGRDENW